MTPSIRTRIQKILKGVSGIDNPKVVFGETDTQGEYASPIAFEIAKREGRAPLDAAKDLVENIRKADSEKLFSRAEAAPPGFLNFWLTNAALKDELALLIKTGKAYGKGDKKKEKVQIEFVSANPTGPLTMANGRGGFLGAALANILTFAGYKVTREYYVNDAGGQVKILGASILAELGAIPKEERFYKGAYIKELAGRVSKEKKLFKTSIEGELAHLVGTNAAMNAELEALKVRVGKRAAELLLKEIQSSLKKAGIKFDVWTSEEKDIRKKGLVEKTLGDLTTKRFIVEREGALWLEKEIAGEKERVLKKSDGEYTYYLVDLAYHRKSFEKHDRVINLWGADHHGNVQPMKEGVRLFGIDPERLSVIMFQPVRLVEDGKEVKMSKRAGEFVTLDELIKEVGLDVTRFFFLMFTPGNRIDFDLKLAKEQSNKNPVYYVQYAYVRAKAVLKKAKALKGKPDLSLLTSEVDKKLILELAKFPDLISDIASDYEVSRLLRHLLSLARAFHDFYEKERVVGEAKEVALARRALVGAVAVAFEQAFDLLGISKVKKM